MARGLRRRAWRSPSARVARLAELRWADRSAVIALSGWGDPERSGPLHERFDARLAKPAALPELLEAIDRAVRMRRAAD